MVFDFKKCFGNAKTIAAAVSGGSDSMALFCLLLDSPEKHGAKVVAINVEHGIRGENSARDSEFVKEFCKKRNVPLASFAVDAKSFAEKQGLSLEQAARTLRYECFFKAIDEGFCDVVATAHHSLDNLETVLFNLFRGTGLKGAAGIAESGYNGRIVRPMLGFTKAEINDYIKGNEVPFVTDETNFSDEYSRNFLRLKVIPKVKELFPEAEKSVYRFSCLAAKENDYLENEAIRAIKLVRENERTTEARISSSLPEVIFKRAAIHAIKVLGVTKDWENAHIEAAYELTKKETGKSLNLLSGVVCTKEYGEIVFTLNAAKEGFCEKTLAEKELSIPFCGETTFSACGKNYKIEQIPANGVNLKSGLYLAAEKIPENAVIRFFKNGDTFKKFGGGTKKLCDIFTDEKIPFCERGTIPVLACESRVLAIFGRKISDDAKADENTKILFKLS